MDPMRQTDTAPASAKNRWGQASTILIAVCALVRTLWLLLAPDSPEHSLVASDPKTAQKVRCFLLQKPSACGFFDCHLSMLI